ncbi:aldo/keto reductase [Deinococcus phoenicis]|uniref:aldo/keto reductase n=1 Tax=Deinococcus phoenicis TaxID=1476583 RepID=UPI000685AFEE|nr:aldo/keto reductase [Deinococcus phoenicis]
MKRLGRNGPHVSALGLGCGSFIRTGEGAEQGTVRTIQAALDAGFTFLDTADFYGSGVSEMLVGRAIRDRRDQAFLSVKFGAEMAPSGRIIGLDGRPNAVKNFAAYSLKRLGVEVIDLYSPRGWGGGYPRKGLDFARSRTQAARK